MQEMAGGPPLPLLSHDSPEFGCPTLRAFRRVGLGNPRAGYFAPDSKTCPPQAAWKFPTRTLLFLLRDYLPTCPLICGPAAGTVCRPSGARRPFLNASPGLAPGATFSRPLRGLEPASLPAPSASSAVCIFGRPVLSPLRGSAFCSLPRAYARGYELPPATRAVIAAGRRSASILATCRSSSASSAV
jgi:hypothetical protein